MNLKSSPANFDYLKLLSFFGKRPLLLSSIIIFLSSTIFGLWFKITQVSIASPEVIKFYPLTGYLISTSNGKVVDIFGWFNIPALISKNTKVRDIAIELHYYMSYGIAVLLLGHVAAALKHQFFDKDGALVKMLWR